MRTISIVATAKTILYGRLIRGAGSSSDSSLSFMRYGQNLITLACVVIPGSMKAGLLIEFLRKP